MSSAGRGQIDEGLFQVAAVRTMTRRVSVAKLMCSSAANG
jgi:hypothetical protein